MPMTAPSQDKRGIERSMSALRAGRPWCLSLILFAAAAVVYANSLSVPFIFDDVRHIALDESIRQFWPPGQVMADTTRPMVKLSLAVNYAIGGQRVVGYHVFNLAVHILAGLTLFGIVRRTLLSAGLRNRFENSAAWLAFAAALIWLVHPLNTQAVTYVIQRSESLMALFYLLTLYGVIRGAEGRGGILWSIAAVGACALGMMTKEVMVTAPLVVLLYDRTFLSASWWQALKSRPVLYVALAATWLVLASLVGGKAFLNPEGSAGFAMEQLRPLTYAMSQPAVILHYLHLAVWPQPLCFDYGWPVAEGSSQIAPALLAIIGLLFLTGWALWRRSPLGFVAACFFVILAPTSSIMPINDLAVEHRMYLPLAAVAVLSVLLFHRALVWAGRSRAVLSCVLLAVAVAVLGHATWRRNIDYQSNIVLWQSVVRAAPRNPRGYSNLGLAYQLDGEMGPAMENYEQSLQLEEDFFDAHVNLGGALVAGGQVDQAMPHLRRALDLKPDNATAHNNMGNALAAQGKRDEAMRHYRRAMQINPQYADAYYNMAVLLAQMDRLDDAAGQYRVALKINPNHIAAHLNLGVALNSLGRLDEAMQQYQQALALRPGYVLAHYHLGNAYQSKDMWDEAIEQYRRVVQIEPDRVEVHNSLGTVLAMQGRFDQAIEHFRRALRIDPDSVGIARNLDMALRKKAEQDASP